MDEWMNGWIITEMGFFYVKGNDGGRVRMYV